MTDRKERYTPLKATRGGNSRPMGGAALAEAARLYQSGRLAEAEHACRQVLALSPREPYALYLLGMVATAAGQQELAQSSLAEAVALRPREPAIHNAIGLLRAAQGRYDEAFASHDRALKLNAGDVGALLGRGLALAALGKLADSERSLRRARALAPSSVEVVRNHASVLAELGQTAEAAQGFIDALALDPRLVDVRLQLVELFCDIGRAPEAMRHGLEAIGRAPMARESRAAFMLAITRAMPAEHDPAIVAGIIRCFESPDIEHSDLARPAALQLRACYSLDAAPAQAGQAAADRLLREGAFPPVLADRLLRLLLTKTVNRDLALEAFLTAVRRAVGVADGLGAAARPFLAALALQCFNNNYVFAQSEAEERRHAIRKATLDMALSAPLEPTPVLEDQLLHYALYAPLVSLDGAAALAEAPLDGWSAHFRPLLQRTLLEPMEEREIADAMPSLGESEDETSRAVKRQYEEQPYPRWFALPRPSRTRLFEVLRQRHPRATLPEFIAGKLDILVAGAGTGVQPMTTALALEDVEVLAVDLSHASLAYGERMRRRLGVDNVKFLQGDLLRLGELGREFPVIEVVGVLHHLQSPTAGWRVLVQLLQPGGFMRVGLYSEAARKEVVAARERIAALGLAPVPGDIRDFRERVLFGIEAAAFPRLALSKDIWDLNGCRDLLFHACEHRFTLPQLGAMLEDLGLEFVGFEHTSRAMSRHYRTRFPQDPAMTDLGNWASIEEAHPDAFPMYVFWCAKPSERAL